MSRTGADTPDGAHESRPGLRGARAAASATVERAALAESEIRYRSLIELLPEKIFLKSREGLFLSCNSSFAADFGLTPAGVLGKTEGELYPSDVAERHAREDAWVAGSGEARVTEERSEVDGSPRWTRITKLPVRGSDGTVNALLGVIRDVTEERSETERMRRFNEELEERVRRRTEELQKAKEAAEAAFSARGEFLANVSHEIRTPLNAIIGFSELLDRPGAEPQEREYLRAIRSAGRSLLTLVNDILDLSKLEAGGMGIETQPVDLRSLVRDIDRIFSPAAAAKGIEYSSFISEELPDYLMLDETRIRQSLLNLVGNAVKFTQAGRVRLEVGRGEVERPASAGTSDGQSSTERPAGKEGIALSFSVEDTGIGIPSEDLDSVFDAFVQQSASIGRAYGGTGLGLAITKRLAAAMGGTLSVESEYGRGSRFTLRLAEVRTARGQLGSVLPGDETFGSAPMPDLTDLARDAALCAFAPSGIGVESRAEFARLSAQAAALGSGALAAAAVSDWIAALAAAAEAAKLAPVSLFAGAARAALARLDVASLRSALVRFGALGREATDDGGRPGTHPGRPPKDLP
ncbi:MAG TPA: ATP-binding protein [Rectinemataceae bacterium]|nr:ATP-binding protein [Rectinemataceae bacterium]